MDQLSLKDILKDILMVKLKITQTRSEVGQRKAFGRTLLSLGLRQLSQAVIHKDTPSIRGMIRSVRHLVSVEALPEEDK